MPTTLTLKNIPDNIYARLKASAEANRRSLNSEAIVCLEAMLLPDYKSAAERLTRVRALHAKLKDREFKSGDIDAMKREGRK